MHQVKSARMPSHVHTMLFLTTFLAKPMFIVNKPLFTLKQTMDVMWQNIPWLIKNIFHVMKYYVMWQNILQCHLIMSMWQKK